VYKKYYVRNTRLAEQDLDDILEYISAYSPKLAFRIQKSFYKKLILLEQFPRMYIKIKSKQFPFVEHRSFVINKYIFVYLIQNNIVEITRVLPCRSNYKRGF